MYQVNNLKISVDTRWTLGGQNGGLVDTNKKRCQKTLVLKELCIFAKNYLMCKKFQISDEFKSLIEREDILWIDEFLGYYEMTAEEFIKTKSKLQLTRVTAYLDNKRFLRLKRLEKHLINGDATNEQIRCYGMLKEYEGKQPTRDDAIDKAKELYKSIFWNDEE